MPAFICMMHEASRNSSGSCAARRLVAQTCVRWEMTVLSVQVTYYEFKSEEMEAAMQGQQEPGGLQHVPSQVENKEAFNILMVCLLLHVSCMTCPQQPSHKQAARQRGDSESEGASMPQFAGFVAFWETTSCLATLSYERCCVTLHFSTQKAAHLPGSSCMFPSKGLFLGNRDDTPSQAALSNATHR